LWLILGFWGYFTQRVPVGMGADARFDGANIVRDVVSCSVSVVMKLCDEAALCGIERKVSELRPA
jgi:hypothetical protein